MEPASISGAVGAARAMLSAAGYAWDKVKKSRGDYGIFWDHFEATLKRDPHDIPWDQMERYRYEPEFIGRVTVVIKRWDLPARQELEEMFVRDVEALPDGRYPTKEVLAARLIEALLDSANHAAEEFEKTSRQILGAVDAVGGQVSDLSDSLGSDFVSQVVEGVVEGVSRKHDQAETAKRAGSGQSPEPQPLQSLAQRGDEGRTPRELVDVLAAEDPAGGQKLRELLERGGSDAVVALARDRELEPGDTLAFWVTIARIAAKTRAFAEAEAAYLSASRLQELDERARTRQIVRAANIANVRGDEDGFRTLLDEARSLDPDHPGVRIAEARASGDSQWVLDHLAHVEPENQHEEAILHVTRAQAYLALVEEDLAAAELDKARTADATNLGVREFACILPLISAQRRVARGDEIDRQALRRAAQGFEDLRCTIEPEGRLNEAAQLAARAAEAYAVANDYEAARSVLQSIQEPAQLPLEVRLDLGRSALVSRQAHLVTTFIEESDREPEARLLRADTQALTGNQKEREEAVKVLTDLLDVADEDVRNAAAFALLATAATETDVAWSDKAADLMKVANPTAEAGLRAENLRLHGDFEGAEQALLPQAGTKQGLRLLRDLAAERGDWDKAQDRSRSLIAADPAPRDRLSHAEILRRAGGEDDAKTLFLALARDASMPAEMRSGAFGSVMEMIGDDRNYVAIRDLAREWHEAVPTSSDAAWNLVFSLARLAEHQQAYDLLEQSSLEAANTQQARLTAEILYRGAPKAEAVRQLEELSNRFDREEQLEGLLILTFIEAEQEGIELDEALASEVQERFNSFTDRFPDSKLLSKVEAASPEDLLEVLREMQGDSIPAQRDVQKQIADGELPVNALAIVSPVSDVGTAWAQLSALPLGFAVEALEEHERLIAGETIGSAAVWDPSSICTAGGLGSGIEEKIRASLPGSMIVNETLEDVSSAETGPGRKGTTRTEIGYDSEAGKGFIADIPADEVERQRLRAEGVLRIAKQLSVEPAGGEGIEDDLIEAMNEGPEPWKPFVGSILLAQRTKRPLFSDDRWIRDFAHKHGVRAFGTLALLDALTEKGILDADERQYARLRLAASGGWGVTLTANEMMVEARAVEWDISRALSGALFDRAAWRGSPAGRMQELLRFLQAAYDDAPLTLGKWLRRIIEAGMQAAPHLEASWWSRNLLILAWGLDAPQPRMSDDAFRSLVDETKWLPLHLTTLGADPVLGAATEIMAYFNGQSAEVRAAVLNRLMRRLRLPDHVRLFARFVRS